MSRSSLPRRLAPAPPGVHEAVSNDAPRRNVGTACRACRARKLKCSNDQPCSNCLKNNIECTIDKNNDKRRRGVLKRKIDALEEKETLLLRLVHALQESENRRAFELINIIRSDASLDDISLYLDTQLSRARLEGTPELVEGRERISDTPVFTVPARPWTSVVQNDAFVSHLLSLWFTWVHPLCNWIDRDLFIRDMQSGNPKSKFCSPFLVNAILADACAYSDYPETYSIPRDVASKGARFFNEAKHHLKKEEGRITLSTVQGLGAMWLYAYFAGKERSSWIYHSQLTYAVQELSQRSRRLSKADEETLRLIKVTDNTIWGLYNVNTMYSSWYSKIPSIKPPRHSTPTPTPASHDPENDQWYAYPIQSVGTQSHTTCLSAALCDLNRITYDLSLFFYDSEYQPTWSEVDSKVNELHSRLRDWMHRLPNCLKHESGFHVPHILSLHVYYHSIAMRISTIIQQSPVIATPQHVQETRFSCARTISKLIHHHRNSRGSDRIPISNIKWITDALIVLLEDLDDRENREAFMSLSITARTVGRRWQLGRMMLGLVQDRVVATNVVLPDEAIAIFSDLDVS